MGAEFGFEYAYKYKDASVKDILVLEEYFNWRDNQWMRDNYITFLDYCRSNNIDYNSIPEADVIEFYDSHRVDNTGSITGIIEFWCSIGKIFDKYVTENLHEEADGVYCGITLDYLKSLDKWVTDKLEAFKLIPVEVLNAYIDKDNKCNTLIKCAGIEVADEQGNRKFVDSDQLVFVSSKGFDYDEQYAYKKLKTTIPKLKSIIQKGECNVWYYRSE